MLKINFNKIKNIEIIRQLISIITILIALIWILEKNDFLDRLIISPFLICIIAKFGEIICLLIKKERWTHLFQIIYFISFFSFVFAFLIYALIYSLKWQNYWVLLLTVFFFFVAINDLKKYLKNKSKIRKI